MKQVKALFIIVLCLLSLAVISCMPGGTQPAQGWSGVIFQGDVLYMGSMKGEVVAVNPATRTLEWSYAFSSESSSNFLSCGQASEFPAIYGPPVIVGDMVCVGIYSGKVYALNEDGGGVRWAYPKEGSIGPVVGGLVVEGDTIYISSSDGRIYALDAVYGELKWKSEILDEKLWTAPAIDGGVIYVSTFGKHIYSLSPADGSLLPWSLESDIGFVSSPVFYQGTIFVGGFDNNLYAIKAGASEPAWKFSGSRWFWSAPVVNDGIVYAGCLDGRIYAINSETGNLEWEFDAQSPIVASPVREGDLLVVIDESGNVYVFDTKAGAVDKKMMPVKTISIGAEVRGSLCIQEGIVYVRAQNNVLYVLDIDRGMIDWQLSLDVE